MIKYNSHASVNRVLALSKAESTTVRLVHIKESVIDTHENLRRKAISPNESSNADPTPKTRRNVPNGLWVCILKITLIREISRGCVLVAYPYGQEVCDHLLKSKVKTRWQE